MATYETPREIASAWIENRNPTRRLASMYAGKTCLDGQERPCLFSYGPHFPLAIQTDAGILVNLEWYSATTRRHQTATEMALNFAGFILSTSVTIDGTDYAIFRNPYTVYPPNALECLKARHGA